MINAPATTCEFRMKGSAAAAATANIKMKTNLVPTQVPGAGILALAGPGAGSTVARQTQTTIDGLHTLPGHK